MGAQTYLGMPPPSVVAWIKAERDRKGPLFFEANEPGASVAMRCYDDFNWQQTDLKCHLQYSTDKMATWAAYNGNTVELDDCTDNRVYFRADPDNPNTNGFCKQDWEHEEAWTQYFKIDKSVKAGGNIQFLLESTGTRTDVPEYGFCWLFGKQEYDEETGDYTYSCTSLTAAPVLPAMTLAKYCYLGMFSGCTSLATAPALPATTLLAYGCYQSMFNNCSKLTSMDVNFTAWNPTDNMTANWVNGAGIEATGEKTFTCPRTLPQMTGNSYIPSGWTIVVK